MTPKSFFLLIIIAILCTSHPQVAAARDLVVGIGDLPPHAVLGEDGQPKGGFVEVVKAIDRAYTEGTITIKILPVKRATQSLLNGQVDFMIPYIANPEIPAETLPYSFASEPVVDVAFVLYSRADLALPRLDRPGELNLETLRGADTHFTFKISGIDSFRQGLLRASLGRTDGFIGEQDACDMFIRQNKAFNLRRTLFAKWKSSIMIRKGPDGEEVDRILSNALRQLKQNGELQKITDTIHRPYDDWQPYLTGGSLP